MQPADNRIDSQFFFAVISASMVNILIVLCIVLVLPTVKSQFLSDAQLQLRLLQEISAYDKDRIRINKRSLSIYYMSSSLLSDVNTDIISNNLKIFVSAVLSHKKTAKHHAFYIFCIGGREDNIPVLSQYLPYNATNVAFIKTPIAHNDLFSHIHMVSLLGETIISKFHSILFLNQDVRGPFVDRANGEWWRHFIDIMDENPSVALVGPLISCEMAPHVQTHVFAMRSDAALEIFSEFNPRSSTGKRNRAKHIETAITAEARALGYDVSSIYYKNQFNKTVFDGSCQMREGNTAQLKSNPTSWCEVRPKETVFMMWGGLPLRIRGYYCQSTVDEIQRETVRIGEAEASLKLSLPETLYGGKLHLLHKEYNKELWLDRSVKILSSPLPSETSKVCFIVRSAIMHGKVANQNSQQVVMDLAVLIQTFLRQNNTAWEAYFIVTDDQPFDDELRATLSTYGDARLHFLNIEKEFRQTYNPVDAGYPASDEAMRIVAKLPQCAWISVTNGDNAYGSAVVDKVLSLTKQVHPSPELVLMPMDSRNFDNLAYKQLREARGGYKGWTDHCHDFEDQYANQRYGFASYSIPEVGGVDIAAVFILRDKFVSTNIYINAYSSAKVWNCRGCQDGLWVHNMVYKKKWVMHRPPIDSLSTIVFHGPSPLWCVAAGHVWYDRPDHFACLSHKTISKLHQFTEFDWPYYHLRPHEPHICLRLSQYGYEHKDDPVTKFI